MSNDPWNRAPVIKSPVGQFLLQIFACGAGAIYYFFNMADNPTSRGAIAMLVTVSLGVVLATTVLIRKMVKDRSGGAKSPTDS